MRILITNVELAGYTGTEVFVGDLARGLAARGHHALVYSPVLGEPAAALRGHGITVVDRLSDLGAAPQLIHGHHHVPTIEALLHFPSVPGLFVCHDRLASTDIPPLFERVRQYVAVDHNCAERLQGYGISQRQIRIIGNAVDVRRFARRPPLPAQPRRALVFSNYAGFSFDVGAIRDACGDHGIALDVVGLGSGRVTASPQTLLRDYDLVFAKARCAMEAMAVGCAVVLCDHRGLGPLVRPHHLRLLKDWNFGMRVLDQPLDRESVGRQIERYDPDQAAAVGAMVRAECNLEAALDRYEVLYRSVIVAGAGAGDDDREQSEFRRYLTRQLEAASSVRDPPEVWRCEPLARDALASIETTLVACPAAVARASVFEMEVEIGNRGAGRLSADPPNPVNLSYHWFSEDGSERLVFEGLRTPLMPPLHLDERRRYRLQVAAPAQPGCYRLHFTLVQELVAWLDEIEPRLALECVVRVD